MHRQADFHEAVRFQGYGGFKTESVLKNCTKA